MSRKTVLLLATLYFLAALAFSVFHVLTNPFLSNLNAPAASKAVAGAVLLYGGAGLLPLIGWGFITSNLGMRCGRCYHGHLSE
jgi:hypothetical protein